MTAYNTAGARKVPQGGVAIAADKLLPLILIPVKLTSPEAMFAIDSRRYVHAAIPIGFAGQALHLISCYLFARVDAASLVASQRLFAAILAALAVLGNAAIVISVDLNVDQCQSRFWQTSPCHLLKFKRLGHW